MAEQIPFSLAASLIKRLASSAFREFGRIYGVMDELEGLKDTIESIKGVLLVAEEKQEKSNAVKSWIRRLKEVVEAADNLFDDIAIEDMRHKVDGRKKKVAEVCHFFSFPCRIAFRREMAHEIENIRKKFNTLFVEMSALNLIPRDEVTKQNESAWRETCSFVLESNIIGRGDSKREIINMLKQSDENQNVSFIAIVGLGGLGKTAIAKLVYNDVEVQNFFQKRMWVCVSDNFDVKAIVMKILESLIAGKCDNLPLDILQNKLRENLSGQRYLLVLDDIWNENNDKGNQLRDYLMCGAEGSKVLVTTRSEMVARTMGVSTPYFLKYLTTEESWSLLKKIVFGEDAKRMNHKLESIGKKIAEKCGGVPLAIRAVGGLLQRKDEEIEWNKVLDDEIWELSEVEDSIIPVLKLSYQDLSPQLRQCFAYCSLYPKDWEIERNELIQVWMAQGFLECSSEKQHMEDVGNEFVKIFLMKSFFQDAEFNAYGEIFCFRMHDLMHDLATQVAGDDCYLDSEGKRLVGRPMQVSLESNDIGLLHSVHASRLQTLFLRPTWPPTTWKKRELYVFSTLKRLRILNLSFSFSEKLPDSIGKLKHLRYLDLSNCKQLACLPKSISNLVCLQTLKLDGCSKLQFSTKVVTKLINLRHLDIRDCKAFDDMIPAGLQKLSSLQYLSSFVVGDGGKRETAKLNELKDLNNLRGRLEIMGLDSVRDVALESQEVNLKDKKLLRSLDLRWRESRDNNSDNLQLLENLRPHQDLKVLSVWDYPGVRFSNWLSLVTNIVEISLNFFSNCRYLPPLECLPSLKSLRIQYMKELEYIYFGEVSPTASTFFPSLESLRFNSCDKLRGWQRMGDDVIDTEYPHNLSLSPFPRLSELTISGCPKLTCMPTFSHLVKGLTLYSSSVKPLTETLNIAASISASSSFTPLSMLKSLEIGGELVDIEALPKEWMQNLTSLQHLTIEGSESLSFQEFEIWFMDNLDYLPSLQTFTARHCSELKALPDWICNLPTLQNIKMENCRNLASLPEGMPRLTNLQTLEIIYCPLLQERCERETGAEWRKIAHIPNII